MARGRSVVQEINATWDASIVRLTNAFVATDNQVKEGKAAQAQETFSKEFHPIARSLFRIMPQTYPPRFGRVNDWCSWIEGLTKQSAKTRTALQSGQAAQMSAALDGIRVHFYNLHREAGALNTSDLIYLFWRTIQKDQPPVKNLQQAIKLLETATPSMRARVYADAFQKAKAQWLGVASSTLADGTLDANELQSLRQTTETFYLQFGRDLE